MTKVLVPSGALGLGFSAEALAAGVAARPDVIAIDGGSTDSGPHYLGTATSKYSQATVRAEWRALMLARAEADVPLVLGSCGTCGADPCVDAMLAITREIAAELDQSLTVARLYSSQPTERIVAALPRIRSLAPELEISADLVRDCTNIVALAGAEQVQAALATGADIVLAGRTTDTALLAALPLSRGDHAGAAWHGAKIGECGAFCSDDPASGTIMVEFDAEGFTVTPMAAGATCTPRTVAAHMLYENADPFVLREPGGHLDVAQAQYEARGRSVRVTGSQWVRSADYTVKLEGARLAGYQTISLTLVRDPVHVAAIEAWIASLRNVLAARVREALGVEPAVEFRLVGRSATLGVLEPSPDGAPEVGVLTIVTAETQVLATEIARMANPLLLHHSARPGEPTPTFAFPFSPPEIERGAIHEFCLNHVMTLDDPMEAFRLETVRVGE